MEIEMIATTDGIRRDVAGFAYTLDQLRAKCGRLQFDLVDLFFGDHDTEEECELPEGSLSSWELESGAKD